MRTWQPPVQTRQAELLRRWGFDLDSVLFTTNADGFLTLEQELTDTPAMEVTRRIAQDERVVYQVTLYGVRLEEWRTAFELDYAETVRVWTERQQDAALAAAAQEYAEGAGWSGQALQGAIRWAFEAGAEWHRDHGQAAS